MTDRLNAWIEFSATRAGRLTVDLRQGFDAGWQAALSANERQAAVPEEWWAAMQAAANEVESLLDEVEALDQYCGSTKPADPNCRERKFVDELRALLRATPQTAQVDQSGIKTMPKPGTQEYGSAINVAANMADQCFVFHKDKFKWLCKFEQSFRSLNAPTAQAKGSE